MREINHIHFQFVITVVRDMITRIMPYIESVDEQITKVTPETLNFSCSSNSNLKKHIESVHEGKKE